MPRNILLGYFLTGQVYYFPSKHFHHSESVSDTEAGSYCILVQLTFCLGFGVFRMSPPLALRKDPLPDGNILQECAQLLRWCKTPLESFLCLAQRRTPFL